MATPTLDLKNVQGDIIIGLQKRVEAFWFGSLKSDAKSIEGFRKSLKSYLLPQITSTQDVIETQKKIDQHKSTKPGELLPITLINLAFSYKGLNKLGLKSQEIPTGVNQAFSKGQQLDAIENLGDPVDRNSKQLSTWSKDYLIDPQVQNNPNAIDFVILIASSDEPLLNQKIDELAHHLGSFLSRSFLRKGNVRPGSQAGHEHFGFLDGISAPVIENVNAKPDDKKSGIVKANVILLGQADNTDNLTPEQLWVKDGSYLVFRELRQLVPEFQTFCDEAAKSLKNPKVSGDLIGARVVGRWKSGAPITLAPLEDNPKLNRAQDFDYSDELKQERCPYAAHVRKTNPRNGIEGADPANAVLPHLMVRNGIPYGPELTKEEKETNQTKEDRGLLFVAYQSHIEQGFQFVQKLWCNNVNFPVKNPAKVTAGFDLLIGQTSDGSARTAQNIKPLGQAGIGDPNNVLTAPKPFVVPHGGEYFLIPPLKAIKEKLGIDGWMNRANKLKPTPPDPMLLTQKQVDWDQVSIKAFPSQLTPSKEKEIYHCTGFILGSY